MPQEAPRIDEQPKRVCLDAPRAIFQVENRAAEPILAILSVERWSDEGDTAGWAIVQEDITQRQARPKQVRNVKLDARQRRNVAWELKKRIGPPALVTGRHRLVVDLVRQERRDSRHRSRTSSSWRTAAIEVPAELVAERQHLARRARVEVAVLNDVGEAGTPPVRS